MDKPRISVDSISSKAFTILTISSEEELDITYVHRVYTPDMSDTTDDIVRLINTGQSDVWLSLITIDNKTGKYQIIIPNQYLTEFQDLQKHDVIFYLMHQFACVKTYNKELETEDDDEYRTLAYAYDKTIRHFGTERILEYASQNDDPIFEIPLRVLKLKAETTGFCEPNPDESTVDICTGTNMRDLKMELII